MTPEQVELGYRLLLGRRPERPQVIEIHVNSGRTVEQFGWLLMQSQEFRMRMRDATGLVGALPPPPPAGVHAMPRGRALDAMPIYYFVHIPKTAGTAMWKLLGDMFHPFVHFYHLLLAEAGGEAQLAERLAKEPQLLQGKLLVCGHFPVTHPLVRHAPRRKVLLSVLREPVERAVSFYDHVRSRADHPLHERIRDVSFSRALAEFPEFADQVNNYQLRQLFGTVEERGIRRMLTENNYVIGRFDELPRFIEAVENVTGLKRCSELITTNVKRMPNGMESGADQPDFAAVAEELRRRNAAEIAFYEAMGPVRVTVSTGAAADEGA
ncbi:sulfotransferase family 2 domain-containing protein [Roseococcus microcysteis]|uniref:sulfotransferase family 2 domain-containing protein n=1 Tax=Roseococcus microcysteis TaxID=2771361 RepID=UPI00168BD62D|nr:sulfotransferase family 2 domain-containing protein [Roseococcus microcysteis]